MKLADASLLKQQCFVNGAWSGEPSIDVTNPATGETIAKIPYFGEAETIDAVEKAQAAFKPWAAKTAKERGAVLRKWFDLMMANQEDLALIMTSEQGKPMAESRGEVAYGAAFAEFYAEEAKRVYGETIPSFRADARVICIKQPIGVVGAITPWNFPLAMITRKVAPALAAGCTIVCKPATETPLTALAVAELADRAGFPPGVFNLITGNSRAIGGVLTSHAHVKAITFTGSTEIGKLLMRQAADTVKRVGMELGGNAPFIVFDDADIDAAVEGAMVSKYRNMGQTCVCANRLYVQDKVYDRFVEKLAGEVLKMKVGNGVDVGVMQGPLINPDAVKKVEEHIADAVANGASIVVGGSRHALGGTFFEPTVLKNVTTRMLVTQEETFGPVAPVYRFKDEEEVIEMANNTQFGLASYFYARDIGRVWRVAEALEYGMVGINSGLISSELVPFGGVKESGIGREGSHYGMDEFVDVKYMLMAGL